MYPLFYDEQERFFVAVDSIILGFKEGKIYLLVSKRKFEPLVGQDTLMGGFLQPNESIKDAVRRVLKEYTGLDNVFMEQVGAYGDRDRDAGDRVVSIAYYALINLEQFDDELCQVHNATWKEIDTIGQLIFDHNQMVIDAIKLLRKKAATQPVGFNLLPEKFTLPQLQLLYEAIYQTTFDKRNFRKKILEMNILEKLEEKDKSNSKKGAFLYRFNKEKYDELLKEGFYFSI